MKISIKLFLLCFVCVSVNLVFGQERVNKKDQKEIQRVCGVYLRQYNNVLTNFDAPTDSLISIISVPLKTMVLSRRSYFQKMGYEDIQFPEYSINRLELEDSIGCIVGTDEGLEFKVNLKKESHSWIVFGYDNHKIDQADIEKHNKFIEEELKTLVVKDSIKEILKKFVDGWSEMRQFEKSDLLKSTVTSEFYEYLLKDTEYLKVQGFRSPKSSMTIKELGRVEIHEDKAHCRIIIKGMGGSRIILLLQNNVWRVAGENDRICSQQDVKEVEDKIALYKELDKFNDRISRFNLHVEAFFKTGDRSLLKETASDQLIDQLEIYRRLAGTMDTNFLSMRGLSESSWLTSSFKIYGDITYYKTRSDSVRWVKKNNDWLLDELFVGVDVDNQYNKAHQTFYSFMDMFFFTYSYLNMYEYNQGPEIVAFPEETDYSRVVKHHLLDRHSPRVVYASGNDQLIIDLQNQAVNVSTQTTYKGVVYVEFDVDNLGKAKNIRALDQIGTKQAQIAEFIVSQLGNWLPNDNKQSSLTNMVIAVQF